MERASYAARVCCPSTFQRQGHEATRLSFPLRHLNCDDGVAVSGKVEKQQRVEGFMVANADRCVDVKCSPETPPLMALVSVPEDVKPRS